MAADNPESQPIASLHSSAQPAIVTSNSNTKVVNRDSMETSITKDLVVKIDEKDKELDPPAPKKPALENRYNELLKLIAEVGKDIKPAYTNGKGHSDRLRKNIGSARNVLRECLGEIDRISRSELQKPLDL